jgi:hypothetical protein
MHVSETAATAFRHAQLVTVVYHFTEELACFLDIDLRSARHFHVAIPPVPAGALLALPFATVFRALVWLIIEVKQRALILACAKINTSPAPSVTAIRPALIHVLFTSE